jgi:hypothetical protein
VNSLEPEQQENVRGALRALYMRYGTWLALGRAMGVGKNQLRLVMGKRYAPSAGLALRAAKLAGMHVEDVLAGKLSEPERCPTCRHVLRSSGGSEQK